MPTEIEAEHARIVRKLRKPGCKVIRGLNGRSADAVHMALGIAGETGELIDAVKKWAIYGKPLDIANVVEELGDLEFYLEGLRQCIGLTRNDTLRENVLKLSKRYSAGHYSDRQAQQRADKEPGQ